jgi:hypothetical protein
MLLHARADVAAQDSWGETPLHDAAGSKMLLAAGASASAQDNHGRAPVHVAAEAGTAEIAMMLLSGCITGATLQDHSFAPDATTRDRSLQYLLPDWTVGVRECTQ